MKFHWLRLALTAAGGLLISMVIPDFIIGLLFCVAFGVIMGFTWPWLEVKD